MFKYDWERQEKNLYFCDSISRVQQDVIRLLKQKSANDDVLYTDCKAQAESLAKENNTLNNKLFKSEQKGKFLWSSIGLNLALLLIIATW